MDLSSQIIDVVLKFNSLGLSVGSSGNASTRTEKGFYITPTGMKYHELTNHDIVECDYTGNVLQGNRKPSSEWRFHSGIYLSRPDVNAIVHVHSPYATALACNRKSIPAFHYMVARAGGDSVRCAKYATFGTDELSENAISALENRKACLLANHGQIALGEDLTQALDMAIEIEELAKQYNLALQSGDPVLLDEQEIKLNLEKFKTYGKQ